VGTQLPFDRLVRVVDEWAGRTGRTDVVAQVGPGKFVPQYIQAQPYISPPQFARNVDEAELIISHAGMGTILNALGVGKPILVLPRLAKLGEHRNDHQLATARRFKELGRIMVAMDEADMSAQLDALEGLSFSHRIGPYASEELLNRVRSFIES
jgi:UDP-N-acetylglucosamine transferase subunit ALG13